MKTFTITCEDYDTSEIELAMKASDYKNTLSDIVEWIKKEDKYGKDSITFSSLREEIWEIIKIRNADPYE